MSLETQLVNLVTRIGTEFKSVRTAMGTLASLTTTSKSSLVSAINEVNGKVVTGAGVSDDTTSASTTWSSSKISSEITGAITTLINGAGTDSDTLKELADRITALAQVDAGLVSAKASQVFTVAEQGQARLNIGAVSAASVGNTERDLVADFNAALA